MKQTNVSQMPGPAVLAAFTAFVNTIVDERLRAIGAISSRPDPRALRQSKGITVAELAAKSGLSAGVISKIENGRARRPAPATLDALARAIGIPEQEYRQSVAAQIQRLSGVA